MTKRRHSNTPNTLNTPNTSNTQNTKNTQNTLAPEQTLLPEQVMPEPLAKVMENLDYWFVIGGQAVRCLCPYRLSRDVDVGVTTPDALEDLVEHLKQTGRVELIERSTNTVHLLWNEIKVSVFVLDRLAPFTEERRLTLTGILATKLHAILDRGTRRDFFDLYVTLNHQRMGILECIQAMREVYGEEVNETLLLRALTYFDDADREAMLPGEARTDWPTVKSYFMTHVGNLLVPPSPSLAIQKRRVDVREQQQ